MPGEAGASAAGAGVALELDLPVGRQLEPFPPLPGPPARPPDDPVGAEEHLLSLVVEVGTAVDVVEVFEGEVGAAPPPAARRDLDLVRPGDGGATSASVASFASAASRLTDGLDELRDLHQGGTVLGVVGRATSPSRRAPWPSPSVPATPDSGGRRHPRLSRCSRGSGRLPSGRWRMWGSTRWSGWPRARSPPSPRRDQRGFSSPRLSSSAAATPSRSRRSGTGRSPRGRPGGPGRSRTPPPLGPAPSAQKE